MALASYTDLKSAAAGWLNRTDLTGQIPDFITLAESKLNRRLKLRAMETEGSLSVAAGGQSVDLPVGIVAPMGLWAVESDGRRSLRYLDPSQMEMFDAADMVCCWTITGANIVFERPTSSALSLILRYQSAFSLSDASPTNWLLTHHPDAYLFATLVEAAPYERDTEALGIWSARLEAAIQEVNLKEGRSRSLTTLSVDPSLRQRAGAYPRFDGWR